MPKLTYRDIPLLQKAGAVLSATRTAWWLDDRHGTTWYVTESDENQWLEFADTDWSLRKTMTREEFQELFL